eukprot:COSAG02_NODE_848_length_16553_cov_21.228577_17_plen_86_part_00
MDGVKRDGCTCSLSLNPALVGNNARVARGSLLRLSRDLCCSEFNMDSDVWPSAVQLCGGQSNGAILATWHKAGGTRSAVNLHLRR